jgi:hypothetical protein
MSARRPAPVILTAVIKLKPFSGQDLFGGQPAVGQTGERACAEALRG